MAVIHPDWSYWGNAFAAQLLQPVSSDILFTVGLIIVSEVFPDDTQALAGAVFNTAAQLGSALGLVVMQVVSGLVTKKAVHEGAREGGQDSLMAGFSASFWTMFAFMMACGFIGGVGMRRTGKVGLKRD